MRGLLVIALACACTRFTPTDLQPGDAADTDSSPQPDTPGDGSAIPFLSGWTHRKAIDLQKDKVTTPLGQDFEPQIQIAVAANDGDLAARAQPAGGDIVFTAADGTTLLSSELAHYLAGDYVAWVRIPQLSSVTDTRIYLYYGNNDPVASTAAAVWSNHLAVWHLEESPAAGGAGEILDSTPNAVNGTAAASMSAANLVTGKLGNAISFDGADDLIDLPPRNLATQFSISAWVQLDTGSDPRTIIGNAPSNGYRLFVNNLATANRRVVFETDDTNALNSATTEVSQVPQDTFKYVTVVVDKAQGQARIYIDGVDSTIDTSITTTFPTNGDFEIGRAEGGFPWKGKLDEIHIYDDLLTPERIRTNFENQSSPSTFAIIGPEESAAR